MPSIAANLGCSIGEGQVKYEELIGMKSSDLVAIYNTMSDKQLKGWDKAKKILVERILGLWTALDIKIKATDVLEKKPAAARKGETVHHYVRYRAKFGAETIPMRVVKITSKKAMTIGQISDACSSTPAAISCVLHYLIHGLRKMPRVQFDKTRNGREMLYRMTGNLNSVLADLTPSDEEE